MKDLKGLVKPGLIVDVEESDDTYRYVVIDCIDGLQLLNIYDCETYIPLRDFDNDLNYTGPYEDVKYISAIYKNQKCDSSIDNNLQILWIREEVKVTLAQIAEQFNTTVDKLKIIDGN